MSKMESLTVEIKPVLTVDQETAFVCLELLELYCKANNKAIVADPTDCQSYEFRDLIG